MRTGTSPAGRANSLRALAAPTVFRRVAFRLRLDANGHESCDSNQSKLNKVWDTLQPESALNFAYGTPIRLVAGDGYYSAWTDQNRGRTYDVAADGNRFLRLKESGSEGSSASMTIVENSTEELKRLVPVP